MNPLRSRTSTDTAIALLDLIRRESPISRVELSHSTGLTETSISKTVRRLLEAGLIEEAGFNSSGRGKSRTLLRLSPAAMHALGVVLDDTRINCVLTDFTGEILAAEVLKGTRGELPHDVALRIAEAVNRMLTSASLSSSDIAGACLASPGRLDEAKKQLRLSSIATEWEEYDIQKQFTALTSIPARLEKDYGCAALAEHWIARDTPQDFITTYVANGIGAGIIISGELYSGTSSNAGEIGHLPLMPDGPVCRCGNRGCLERIAAPQFLVAAAIEDPEFAERLGLLGAHDSIRADFEKIAHAAVGGDETAHNLIEGAAKHLAQGLLGLTNTLDASQIILAGPAMEIVGGIFASTLQQHLDAYAFARPLHGVEVKVSRLGLDGAAVGAAISVLRSEAISL